MAILKHIANKNADYGEAQRYLMFRYNESTNKPILDENGELIPSLHHQLRSKGRNRKWIDRETSAAA